MWLLEPSVWKLKISRMRPIIPIFLLLGFLKKIPIDQRPIIVLGNSNIISVFNSQGVLTHQKEGLSIDQKGTLEALQKLLRP